MIDVIIPTRNLDRACALGAALEVRATLPSTSIEPAYSQDSAVENMRRGAADTKGNIIAFLHDDCTIDEDGWDAKIDYHFHRYPNCGLLGFGGALGLGTPDLYKRPYQLQQLARVQFFSNMSEAEHHGQRTTQPRRVAVLDGFAQVFRRSAYVNMGGWRDALDAGITFHMYDAWAACRMWELGWETWLLPLACSHHGGLTSVSQEYDAWLRAKGVEGDAEVHTKAHEVIYERFRNVLPIRVEEQC